MARGQPRGKPLIVPPFPGEDPAVTSLAYSPDGSHLVTASQDSILVWDLATRRLIDQSGSWSFSGGESLTLTPDGRIVASLGADVDTAVPGVANLDLGWVSFNRSALAASPKGRTLATGSSDHTVQLWNPPDPSKVDDLSKKSPPIKLLATLTGHSANVTSVAFTPDGATLASGDADGTIRLWDVKAHRAIATWANGGASAATSLSFTPDGQTLISADADGKIRLWQGLLWRSFDELKRRVCGLAGVTLSAQEWNQYAPGLPHHDDCPRSTDRS